jgi:putative FmdB family regulatory protein
MPVYNFRCRACGDLQGIKCSIDESEDLRPRCSKCGSCLMSRVFGAPLIKFKGQGFYSTDNRKADK